MYLQTNKFLRLGVRIFRNLRSFDNLNLLPEICVNVVQKILLNFYQTVALNVNFCCVKLIIRVKVESP